MKHIYDADRCGFWGMFEQKSTDLYICVQNFNLTILQLMCATNCKLIVNLKHGWIYWNPAGVPRQTSPLITNAEHNSPME